MMGSRGADSREAAQLGGLRGQAKELVADQASGATLLGFAGGLGAGPVHHLRHRQVKPVVLSCGRPAGKQWACDLGVLSSGLHSRPILLCHIAVCAFKIPHVSVSCHFYICHPSCRACVQRGLQRSVYHPHLYCHRWLVDSHLCVPPPLFCAARPARTALPSTSTQPPPPWETRACAMLMATF